MKLKIAFLVSVVTMGVVHSTDSSPPITSEKKKVIITRMNAQQQKQLAGLRGGCKLSSDSQVSVPCYYCRAARWCKARLDAVWLGLCVCLMISCDECGECSDSE